MDKDIIGYIDRENFRQFTILLAKIKLIYWLVLLSSRRGGKRIKGVYEKYYFFASFDYFFIRVHENVVQHPFNNVSITIAESAFSHTAPIFQYILYFILKSLLSYILQ